MADTKITALAAIATVDPAADVLPIVDISDTSMAASGTTKKVTSNQILGAGGTATLASATITGALGAAGLNVTGATIPANGVYLGSANNLSFSYASTLGMTLNSTGLGIGASPQGKLHVSNGATIDSGLFTGLIIGASGTQSARTASFIKDTTTPYNLIVSVQDFTGGTTGSFIVRNGSTDQFSIDSSGNPIFQPSTTPATLGTNGMLTVNATSNTNLRFSYRGSDGTTRVANITLA